MNGAILRGTKKRGKKKVQSPRYSKGDGEGTVDDAASYSQGQKDKEFFIFQESKQKIKALGGIGTSEQKRRTFLYFPNRAQGWAKGWPNAEYRDQKERHYTAADFREAKNVRGHRSGNEEGKGGRLAGTQPCRDWPSQ